MKKQKLLEVLGMLALSHAMRPELLTIFNFVISRISRKAKMYYLNSRVTV